MPKDYKHPQAPQNSQAPGWVWLVVGLALGLAVTVVLQIRDARREAMGPQPAADAEPASSQDATKPKDPPAKSKYDFYDLLPSFEVVVPEEETDESTAGPDVTEPGFYVLQVGSFSKYPDADRRKAELALMGIESRIQKVTIDEDRTYHRVRIGPLEDLERLNGIRERLRESGIETLVLKAEEDDGR